MNLHLNSTDFEQLAALTSASVGIPADAVIRDYYIVKLLQNLSESSYAGFCVFKGGTSLSKCYPGSINRFSEDIDLTYIPNEVLTNHQFDRRLRQIEQIISGEFPFTKITEERNSRNKSSYVYPHSSTDTSYRIKLEIGSSVRPDPYSKKSVTSYIHDFLITQREYDAISQYALTPVYLNTLDITRTFLDKVMAVKRHALCGTLHSKVRHIYDVTMLFKRNDIQDFLHNTPALKHLVSITKATDSFYLEKRSISAGYNPTGPYNFNSWKHLFDSNIKSRYESLHLDLLFTSEKQNFSEAISTFDKIDEIMKDVNE